MSYVDDVQRLLNALLLVERVCSIHLSGDLARHDLQDLAAELYEQAVEGSLHLVVNVLAMVLAVRNSIVDELGVVGLLRGLKDQGRVGSGILWLVLGDGREVTRVGDNDLSDSNIC